MKNWTSAQITGLLLTHLYKIKTDKEGRMAAMARSLTTELLRDRLLINSLLDKRTNSESLAKMKNASLTDFSLCRLHSKLGHIKIQYTA